MKRETELAREEQRFYSIPVRDNPSEPPINEMELTSRRRTIRTETDALIERGLLNGDPVALSHCLASTMLVMGGTCAQFGIQPEISDLLLGAKSSIEDARQVLDRALVLKDWDKTREAVTRMQLVCYGISYALGLPYHALLERAHACFMAAEPPTRTDIADVLRTFDFDVVDEAPQHPEPEEEPKPKPPGSGSGLVLIPGGRP